MKVLQAKSSITGNQWLRSAFLLFETPALSAALLRSRLIHNGSEYGGSSLLALFFTEKKDLLMISN